MIFKKAVLWCFNLFIVLFLIVGIVAGLFDPIFFLFCVVAFKIWDYKLYYKKTRSTNE